MNVCLACEHLFSGLQADHPWLCPACGYEPPLLDGIRAHAPEFAFAGGGGFKPEYFEPLIQLEASSFWFQVRNEIILHALGSYKPDATSFLEIGCGTGYVLSGIAQARPQMSLSGSELYLAALPYARARLPDATCMQMDARRIPFSEEFDALGAFDVLEHIEEDVLVLTELHRACKPGGVLILTVPQHPWLWCFQDEHACHVRRYSRREIESKVTSAGWEIRRSTSFVTLLLPLMAFSRFFQRVKRTTPNPEAEFQISALTNRLMCGVMRMEHKGIKAGLNYRWGGSRLIVAEKPTSS